MRIAFYAPMKAPTHPIPSGDRRMARLLMQALRDAGHGVVLASEFRSYDGKGEPAIQAQIRERGLACARSMIAGWQGDGAADRPDLWFTYHVYHKAPDWLGPTVSRSLGLPYVIAEASHAPKRAGGPWDTGYRAAAEAIAAADVVYAMTRLDAACLEPLVVSPRRLQYLPPFIDALPSRSQSRLEIGHSFGLETNKAWLLTVAMMRPGDKTASYRELAAALAVLTDDGRGKNDWQLLIVGDGQSRAEVEHLFADFGPRVRFAGALDAEALANLYAEAAVYVWPGVGEAYGMAFLEAQASGTPVVATDRRGIPDVVQSGITGLLTPPKDARAFAAAIRALLDDEAQRMQMASAARTFIHQQRSVAATAALLQETLP